MNLTEKQLLAIDKLARFKTLYTTTDPFYIEEPDQRGVHPSTAKALEKKGLVTITKKARYGYKVRNFGRSHEWGKVAVDTFVTKKGKAYVTLEQIEELLEDEREFLERFIESDPAEAYVIAESESKISTLEHLKELCLTSQNE